MDAAVVISLASLGLAALTFVATQFGSRRTATASYVEQLEARVEFLEARLEKTEVENERLHDENFRLLRQVSKLAAAANGV